MGSFAPRSVYSNAPSPQTGAGLAALASNQEAIMELPGAQAPQNIEISDNALTFSATPVSAYLIVDTEGQAAADDLEVINPVVSATDNLHDGMLLHLQAADAGRVVTVVNSSSANGIQTVGGGNITLTTNTWCVLQLRSGTWYEISSTQTQTIDGVEFNGTAGITHATTCDTAAATAAKTVTLDGFALIAGAEVTVKFTNGNTASNPTLNISNTGAAPILYQGVAITDASIGANTVCRLYYDGTAWNIVGIVTAPATTSSLGTARLATTAEVQARAAAAGSPAPAVLRPEDISTFAPLFTPALKRQVFQVSGSFSDSVARAMHVTLIAGGGSGGNGGGASTGGLGGRKGGNSSLTIPAGAILNGQVLTVSQTVTVKGGAAGCGGGLYAEGGGGEAGAWKEYDIFLPAGLVLSFIIGAGGLPFTTGYSSNTNGGRGEGNSTSLTAGGEIGGIPGPGGRQGRNYQSRSSTSQGTQGGCGAGGIKHPLFGGGGPAGIAGVETYGPRMGAMPGPGAGEAAVKTEVSNSAPHYPMAGKGGDGALILEYWNNSVA